MNMFRLHHAGKGKKCEDKRHVQCTSALYCTDVLQTRFRILLVDALTYH